LTSALDGGAPAALPPGKEPPECDMGGAYNTKGRNAYKISDSIPERKRQLGRPKRRWESKIK